MHVLLAHFFPSAISFFHDENISIDSYKKILMKESIEMFSSLKEIFFYKGMYMYIYQLSSERTKSLQNMKCTLSYICFVGNFLLIVLHDL